MTAPKILGLVGRSHSGKDEAAKALLANTWPAKGPYWDRFAFADKVKEAAALIFGFSDAQLHGPLRDVVDAEWGFTPRHALRLLGTEVARMIHPDVWIRAIEWQVRNDHRLGRGIVVTDVRFLNEAAAIRRWGGHVVRIVRDPSTAPFVVDLNHPSETELASIECDHEIVNDGTIEDLHRKVLALVATLHARVSTTNEEG